MLTTTEKSEVLSYSQKLRRSGIAIVTNLIKKSTIDEVKKDAERLLSLSAERRDLHLATTDYTPRYMSVVRSEEIIEHGQLIKDLYVSGEARKLVELISGESLENCPREDEELLISLHEKKGDTHGWHWGDYSYALIWVLESPPIEVGGLLQCVPHTDWDKTNPQINKYLSNNPIDTYAFKSGDVYLLRTDTTLHRTLPLSMDSKRIMLNMTFATKQDSAKEFLDDDRWWEDEQANEAVQI